MHIHLRNKADHCIDNAYPIRFGPSRLNERRLSEIIARGHIVALSCNDEDRNPNVDNTSWLSVAQVIELEGELVYVVAG